MNTCDHGHDTNEEVRVLPFGNGNLILCYKHYIEEIRFRQSENREKFPPSMTWVNENILVKIPHPSAYDVPTWGSLKVYNPE